MTRLSLIKARTKLIAIWNLPSRNHSQGPLRMSSGGAFGGARGYQPRPPEKGVFPLDHFGECKSVSISHSLSRSFQKSYIFPMLRLNLQITVFKEVMSAFAKAIHQRESNGLLFHYACRLRMHTWLVWRAMAKKRSPADPWASSTWSAGWTGKLFLCLMLSMQTICLPKPEKGILKRIKQISAPHFLRENSLWGYCCHWKKHICFGEKGLFMKDYCHSNIPHRRQVDGTSTPIPLRESWQYNSTSSASSL